MDEVVVGAFASGGSVAWRVARFAHRARDGTRTFGSALAMREPVDAACARESNRPETCRMQVRDLGVRDRPARTESTRPDATAKRRRSRGRQSENARAPVSFRW